MVQAGTYRATPPPALVIIHTLDTRGDMQNSRRTDWILLPIPGPAPSADRYPVPTPRLLYSPGVRLASAQAMPPGRNGPRPYRRPRYSSAAGSATRGLPGISGPFSLPAPTGASRENDAPAPLAISPELKTSAAGLAASCQPRLPGTSRACPRRAWLLPPPCRLGRTGGNPCFSPCCRIPGSPCAPRDRHNGRYRA